MRIALVHNPEAGEQRFERGDLRRLLEAEGHRVDLFGTNEGGMADAIASGPDVLAVVGGDGTVASAATLSFRSQSPAPLFIIPVGTSNNVSRSLGTGVSIPAHIRALPSLTPRRLDVGRIDGLGASRFFIEGAGVGFIGAMLRRPLGLTRRAVSAVRGVITGRDLTTRMARGVAKLIRDQPPLPIRIVAGGEDLSGDYIAVEAMNIRELGPNITLAPHADHGDGLLDLVMFRPRDRDALAECVERRTTASAPALGTTKRVDRIELSWSTDGHVDDDPWPAEPVEGGRLSISVAGAVAVLA